MTSSFDHLSDTSLLRLYEGIRQQVEADRALGGRYRLVGKATEQRAKGLQAVLALRGVKFTPIVWR